MIKRIRGSISNWNKRRRLFQIRRAFERAGYSSGQFTDSQIEAALTCGERGIEDPDDLDPILRQRTGPGEPLVNAKNVPLVMDRSRLIAMGGYDQTYYIGYEDLDLTYQILAAGKRFSKVELDALLARWMALEERKC